MRDEEKAVIPPGGRTRCSKPSVTVGSTEMRRRFTYGKRILANCRKRQDAKPQGLRNEQYYVSLAANLISKPPETAGRKVMGAKAGMPCQPDC